MSERKSINKYYPPDYNPLEAEQALNKVSKKLKTKNKDAITIRLMTPFSIRCLKCSEYIPKSRKFNGKKELLKEKYLDTIKIYRFSIKCPRCNNMISFRTDPKSADYVMEYGGKKNYESNNGANAKIEDISESIQRLVQQEKENETGNDAEDKMKLLEERLTKLEKEREDDEELEALKRIEHVKRMNESKLHSEPATTSEDTNTQVEDDEELERLVAQAFAARTKTNTTITARPTLAAKVSKVTKKTRNPLGVCVKKKRR